MVKNSVNLRKDSLQDLQTLVRQFVDILITEVVVLRGGYSGTNYRLSSHEGVLGVLKICSGYTVPEVENMAKLMNHLRRMNYTGACHAYELTNKSGHVCTTLDDQPAILLSYVPGVNGDVMVESGKCSLLAMLDSIGENLGRLHGIPASPEDSLLNFRDGGCCYVGRHLRNMIRFQFSSHPEEFIFRHPFVAFYSTRLPRLQEDLSRNDLPVGVLHGDPFLDNVLVDCESGCFNAFVDFEDACIGPLLFDVACCLAGSCFVNDEALSEKQFAAVLQGYSRLRLLSATEAFLLPAFMRHALLCNASWRFLNFNVMNPGEREKNGRSYVELQTRIEYLERPDVDAQLAVCIANLLSPLGT